MPYPNFSSAVTPSLTYKNFKGSVEFDVERRIYRGKIRFIDDLITYEANSRSLLKKEFEAAINDYLDTCGKLGRQPQRARYGLSFRNAR